MSADEMVLKIQAAASNTRLMKVTEHPPMLQFPVPNTFRCVVHAHKHYMRTCSIPAINSY